MSTKPIVETRGVWKQFPGRHLSQKAVDAVRDVNIAISPGRTLCLIGESGSGKSTLTRLILGLEQPTKGSILLDGEPMADRGRRRGCDVGAVFQNPQGSFDPRLRLSVSITEGLAITKRMKKSERRGEAARLCDLVHLPPTLADRFPYQLSGGQLQRAAIARALALGPRLVILDEPLSALDVSVSAQIVNLLLELQEELCLSYLFVCHDLRIARHLAHDVAVMHRGQVVESGAADTLYHPRHPYTQALVQASEATTLDIGPDSPINASSTSAQPMGVP